MPLTYLVGYDGGDASEAAVQLAVRLASDTGADLLVAHAIPEQLGPIAWTRARAAGDELLARLCGVETHLRVVEGPAPHALHDLAVHHDAALLLVGSTHRGGFGRLVPGSVGERLVHAAPCPLVVVPSRSEAPLAMIGVAFDGRDASMTALLKARAMAEEHDAHLVILTATDAAAREDHHHLGAGRTASPVDLDAVVSTAGDLIGHERTYGHHLLAGAAGPALVAACAEGIDLLVVGSRGYGPLHSVLAGSVSRHVIDHAPCPVLVVPRIHEHPTHLHGLKRARASAG